MVTHVATRPLTAPLDRLQGVLAGAQRVLVYCHMNPDPDSLGAALAMRLILKEVFHKQSGLCYRGLVGRADAHAGDAPPAPGKVGQSRECVGGAAEAVDEFAESDGTDAVAANEAQPSQPLRRRQRTLNGLRLGPASCRASVQSSAPRPPAAA